MNLLLCPLSKSVYVVIVQHAWKIHFTSSFSATTQVYVSLSTTLIMALTTVEIALMKQSAVSDIFSLFIMPCSHHII